MELAPKYREQLLEDKDSEIDPKLQLAIVRYPALTTVRAPNQTARTQILRDAQSDLKCFLDRKKFAPGRRTRDEERHEQVLRFSELQLQKPNTARMDLFCFVLFLF